MATSLIGPSFEVAKAFADLRLAGKAREFGLSNARPSFVAMIQKFMGMKLLVNQIELNLLHLDPLTDGTIDQCLTEGMTPMAWSPLAGGRLVMNTPVELTDPLYARRAKLRETIDMVARERETTRGIVALAFLLKHPAGIVPIVGTTNQTTIRELVKATDLVLSREEWYRLLEAAVGHRLA